MLYNLLIAPIETIVDWVFCFISVKFSKLGIIGAVCGVSLVINFLALPLYNIADALQEKERKAAKALEPRVKRIKKAFKGNEQFMMLSTYYKQNDYHPLYVLRSSLSILIEIPFFIAAYHYLSNCEALRGSSFWIFRDLGAPDGLLHIGTFSIHILPIIMTLINFVSGAIYTKEAPMREKVQLYVVALLFLVLLYTSPSGLVIYWILNNLFSLTKNIVMKMKHPGKVLHILVSVLLVGASLYLLRNKITTKKLCLLLFAICVAAYPAYGKLMSKIRLLQLQHDKTTDFLCVLFSGLGIALLCGFLLPASAISTSPEEFSFLGNTDSPLTYVYTATLIFLGFFVIWPFVIYKLFSENVKKWESFVLPLLFILALINTYILKSNYGNLNVLFELDDPNALKTGKKVLLISCLAGLLLGALFLHIRQTKIQKYVPVLLMAVCIAETGLGILKTSKIKTSFESYQNIESKPQTNLTIDKEFSLSKTGQNVIILFLDRAINTFAPEIFKQFPEIEQQFDGFTYYPNTLSFSNFTVMGTPPMYGGYEYTIEEINARTDEMLRDKHDEALLVMPKLFSDAGFETTILDPPWPNYTTRGDLSFFEPYPEITAKEIEDKYFTNYRVEKGFAEENMDVHCQTGCIDFSVLQCLPPFLRQTFYKSAKRTDVFSTATTFFSTFANLYYLRNMTDFTSDKNTFTFFENQTPHDVHVLLNEEYDAPAKIQSDNITQQHYDANVAALKQVGLWFDYLKENGVYDNTRIIVVSDHGRNIDIPRGDLNCAWFGALLLVKDFNASGPVQTDETFMTNADTLFLAKEGLDVSDINPFTGKTLVQNKANGVNIYECLDWNCVQNYRDDYQFTLDDERAWHVSDDIFDKDNWVNMSDWKKQNN